jgi:hypothetical protein
MDGSDMSEHDPMAGLDPWTAGYSQLRTFVSDPRHTEKEIDDLIEAIRATLPHPEPPQLIELVILVDIKMANIPRLAGYVAKMWARRIWTTNPSYHIVTPLKPSRVC